MSDVVTIGSGEYCANCECGGSTWYVMIDGVGPGPHKVLMARCAECNGIMYIDDEG